VLPGRLPAEKAAGAAVVVFTDTGRYVGDADAWAELCQTAYGVAMDLTDAEIAAAVQDSVAAADREARQVAVLRRVHGKKALIIIDVQASGHTSTGRNRRLLRQA